MKLMEATQTVSTKNLTSSAGGIAHNFNNLITAIIGYAKLIKSGRKSRETNSTYAGHIIAASEKGASLIKSLLIFSKKGMLEVMPLSVNDIVSGMSELFTVVVGSKVKLEMHLSDENIMIMADRGQIEQVLMNLVTNANDAMPGGGTLKIKTAFAKLGETFIKAHNIEPAERYAIITVSDEGMGMDEATRAKIFEPFFTTKPFGKGTGLGLSMVYGIIKQHKGYISFDSNPDNGTKFYIYFPETEQIPVDAKNKSESGLFGSGETILLAEDDEHIRGLMSSCLAEFGYNVLEAHDGDTAVDVFEENKLKISLVIADYMMPGKTGNEVCSEIKKCRSRVNMSVNSQVKMSVGV